MSMPLQDEERNKAIVLENENNDQLVTDIDKLAIKELVEHPEVLEVIQERKKRKFTWSGILVLIFGLLLIGLGLLLHTGVYSAEGLIVGIGVIVVIIGILRILIGLIRPIAPDQLLGL